MGETISSAFRSEDHARTMLRVVRDAGVPARIVRTADLSPNELAQCWLDDLDGYACVMFVPEDQREPAEIAKHKFYGLCRWCGVQLKGQTSGDCPDCGTPIDAPRVG